MKTSSWKKSAVRGCVMSPLTSVLLLTATSSVIKAVTDMDKGRTFILNPYNLSWEEAQSRCEATGGSLAKVDHISVIPDMGYDPGWSLWIGLKVNSADNLTWVDGSRVNWTNWYRYTDWKGEDSACVYAITSSNYSWVMTSCNRSLPSLCEIPGGDCRFNVTPYAGVTGYNARLAYMDKELCLQLCLTARDMDCRSLEVNRGGKQCQLSSENRWTRPKSFITGDRYWDYYHFTCINGTYLDGVYVSPNGLTLPPTSTTTKLPSTSAARATTEEGELICVRIKPVQNNETEEVNNEVKELQALSLTYKEQRRNKKKISTPDSRPSATYVGSLAVGLVIGVLGFIVCVDLLSLTRHVQHLQRIGTPCGRCCKRINKGKLVKRNRAIHFMESPENAASGSNSGPLEIAKTSHSFTLEEVDNGEHAVNIYATGSAPGTPKGQVNRKVELHLERIRDLEREYGRSSGPLVFVQPTPVVVGEAICADKSFDSAVELDVSTSECSELLTADGKVTRNSLQEDEYPGSQNGYEYLVSTSTDNQQDDNFLDGSLCSSKSSESRTSSENCDDEKGQGTSLSESSLVDENFASGAGRKPINDTSCSVSDTQFQRSTYVRPVSARVNKFCAPTQTKREEPRVKTSNTVNDSENTTSAGNEAFCGQNVIEIRIHEAETQADSSSEEDSEPVDVDNNRLRVERFVIQSEVLAPCYPDIDYPDRDIQSQGW